MDPFFQLLDLQSGNVIDDFESRFQALLAIREAIERDGLEAGQNLSLMLITGEKQSVVAMQDDLLRMAEAVDVSQAGPPALPSRR
jgi:hypothetical protein